ncbi:MAG: hypothetical protein EAZ21_06565 [Betaproteobacteria bacterium]|nr:MAG: hypothetical protein EAZ21_06565 [Betaproteobacteria bacterium]
MLGVAIQHARTSHANRLVGHSMGECRVKGRRDCGYANRSCGNRRLSNSADTKIKALATFLVYLTFIRMRSSAIKLKAQQAIAEPCGSTRALCTKEFLRHRADDLLDDFIAHAARENKSEGSGVTLTNSRFAECDVPAHVVAFEARRALVTSQAQDAGDVLRRHAIR